MISIADLKPQEARQWIREQRWQKPTAGMALRYLPSLDRYFTS